VNATYFGKKKVANLGYHYPWKSVSINNPECAITLYSAANFQMDESTSKGTDCTGKPESCRCHTISSDFKSAASLTTEIPCLQHPTIALSATGKDDK